MSKTNILRFLEYIKILNRQQVEISYKKGLGTSYICLQTWHNSLLPVQDAQCQI